MTRRSCVLAALSIILALTSALGPDVGRSRSMLAAPLDAPMAAPDNSIALQPFLSGFNQSIFMTHAGDGTNRLWVVEKGGVIKLVVNGNVRSTPYLNLTDQVSEVGEQGLLSLAFHPKYETNGRFFVIYSANPPGPNSCAAPTLDCGDITLQEYHVAQIGNPNSEIANPVPVRTLFSIKDRFSNHNGSTIGFGRDGYLYVSMGDEGSGGDPDDNAQNPLSFYGKMLRLDVDNGGNPNFPPNYTYTIPPSNPFVGNPAFRPEIWALGFRNPYRWSFDRLTGDIFLGDVGQGAWEEIDFLPFGAGGLNFGWDDREGAHCFEPMTGCQTAGRTDPIFEYDRATNGSSFPAAVTGGYRYRGTQNPSLQGAYFYADFYSGKIWKGLFERPVNSPAPFWRAVHALNSGLNITSFGEDEACELYVVTFGGSISRLVESSPPLSCSIRPKINVTSVRVDSGKLQVNVGVTTNSTITANQVQSIAFTQISNAFVTIGNLGERDTPFTFTPPTPGPAVGFTVRRKPPTPPGAPPQAMTVRLTITDVCGPWVTLVGGGSLMP